MKILVVSSKYPPEYSGSGLRAHNLYKRLSKKFNISYDVSCNSLINRKNDIYEYDGVTVCKISYPVKIENLKGFAVVSSNYKAKLNAKIEQLFFKKPFQIFSEMEEAVAWVDELLKNDI